MSFRYIFRPKLYPWSRFGAAVANLGDLQLDGYEDFAVGAPYDGENKDGAVYIYRGAQTFIVDYDGKADFF